MSDGKVLRVVETVLTVALWLFAVTNIDTLLVVAAFCVDRDYRTVEVFLGYYVGVIVALTATIVGAMFVAGWLRSWSFLLGVFPIALGVRSLLNQRASGDGDEGVKRGVDGSRLSRAGTGRTATVLATVIGLSGDNVVVYIPFVLELSAGELRVVIVAYLLGALLVFPVAVTIARRTVSAGVPEWVDRLLVPVTLVLMGMYILVTGGLVL